MLETLVANAMYSRHNLWPVKSRESRSRQYCGIGDRLRSRIEHTRFHSDTSIHHHITHNVSSSLGYKEDECETEYSQHSLTSHPHHKNLLYAMQFSLVFVACLFAGSAAAVAIERDVSGVCTPPQCHFYNVSDVFTKIVSRKTSGFDSGYVQVRTLSGGRDEKLTCIRAGISI